MPDTNIGDDTEDTNEKSFTQDQVNELLAKQKGNITRKLKSKYESLGTVEELQLLVDESQDRKQQEQIDKGEFEQTLQDLASKKDAQIAKRDEVIANYKINTPLVDIASELNAVNPNQVKELLHNNVQLNDEGDVEVVSNGKVRYKDDGTKFQVKDLVTEFLDSNAHFVRPTKATTTTTTNVTDNKVVDLDVTQLDMKNPAHRAKYAKFRKAQGIDS